MRDFYRYTVEVNTVKEFVSLLPAEDEDIWDAQIWGEEPIIHLQETEDTIVIDYLFPGFYLSDDTRYVDENPLPFKQINIKHAGFLAVSGKPLLPSFGLYVQIPPHCTYTVCVEKGTAMEFHDILLLPSQEQVRDSPEEDAFEYDQKFYEEDQLYPDNLVEINGPYDIEQVKILLIHVRPLQYNPSNHRVTGYGSFSITLELEHDDSPPLVYDEGIFSNFIINGSRERSKPRFPPKRKKRQRSRTELPQFLIIHHDSFTAASKKLARWKTMRGLITESISLEEIGTTVDDIKAYIRTQKKDMPRLKYVLLLGDVDSIPAEKILGGPVGNNITDYYYSTPKDAYHEQNELVFPWLSIGRIPVQTAEEAHSVVDKIISYERNPPGDPEYYKKMVFAAYFQDKRPRDGKAERAYMKTMEIIRDHMTMLGFEVDRVYVSSNPEIREYLDGTEIPQQVRESLLDPDTATEMLIDALSAGCMMIGHRDHGSNLGWVHPPLRTAHLEALTGETSSMIYSINCLTGRFDLRPSRDCFAEKLLKIQSGAPSLIAAVRPSHTWLNDDLMKALFDALWGGVLPTFPGSSVSYSVIHSRLGDILNYAKIYLPLTLSGSPQYLKDHFEIYHVIGDPTLEVWRNEPHTITLTARINNGYLDIGLSACPHESVNTIWHKTDFMKKINPLSTHIRLSLRYLEMRSFSKKDVIICFWAPGYRFQRISCK
jgi:hypothetical protein